jgi:ELWxxDGT repeat protein
MSIPLSSAEFFPTEPFVYEDTLLSAGYDASHGVELWRSDGSVSGTMLLKDTEPGPASANLSNFVLYRRRDSLVLFTASTQRTLGDPEYRYAELWQTNGIPSGTIRLRNILPVGSFTVAGSHVFFAGEDTMRGIELWAVPDADLDFHVYLPCVLTL